MRRKTDNDTANLQSEAPNYTIRNKASKARTASFIHTSISIPRPSCLQYPHVYMYIMYTPMPPILTAVSDNCNHSLHSRPSHTRNLLSICANFCPVLRGSQLTPFASSSLSSSFPHAHTVRPSQLPRSIHACLHLSHVVVPRARCCALCLSSFFVHPFDHVALRSICARAHRSASRSNRLLHRCSSFVSVVASPVLSLRHPSSGQYPPPSFSTCFTAGAVFVFHFSQLPCVSGDAVFEKLISTYTSYNMVLHVANNRKEQHCYLTFITILRVHTKHTARL